MHEQIVVQSRFRDGPGLEVGGKNQQWFRNFLHMRRIWQRTDTWRRWSRHCGSARFGAWWLGYFAQFRLESGLPGVGQTIAYCRLSTHRARQRTAGSRSITSKVNDPGSTGPLLPPRSEERRVGKE